MRIRVPGISRGIAAFSFLFEQQAVKAYAGETIAAALISAGIYGFRETRSGKIRGVFCGMGVCGDCQVVVDGESRRACMEEAREGAVVTRHPALASTRPAQPRGHTGELAPDVLVIGAGPAGLSAALTAAAASLDVLVVDERKMAGGQYFKQPAAGFAVDEAAVDHQFAEGCELIRSCREGGVRLLFGATAWGAFGDDRIAILTPENNFIVRARRIVLSTGAYERALPVPGWTLPGVMTTGAAQTLLRAYQTAPGKRVLIAGNGPLNLQVADELCKAGVEVVAVAELASAPWQGAVVSALAMGFYSPTVALTGLNHLLRLRRRRVPVYYRHVLTSVEGDDKAARATISPTDPSGNVYPDSGLSFDIDAVCLNYGFLPQSELARALGCTFDFDRARGQLRAKRDLDGRTSVDHVFIAGDAGGLGGAKVAMDQGELAGHAIAQDLLPTRSPKSREIRRVRRRLQRHTGFQKALWSVFAAPYIANQLTLDDTLICRCEEIAQRSLTTLLRTQHPTLAATKKATRAGMGRCQGRYCTPLIAALSEASGGIQPTADDFFAPRPPARPVPVGRLSQACGLELQAIDLNSTTGRNANKSP
jgi:NADPH-dependent 2,4-dienoyl-CoA reductase/sulfur reductase-like enzyme